MRSFILVLLAAAVGTCADPPKADLTLKDAGGRKVSLRELRGKPVVLNFWATWCVPCGSEMPLFVEMEKEYGSKGVIFVGASLDDAKTKSKVPSFLAEHHVTFPVWYGATADHLDDLKLGGSVPDTAFVDADGRILFRVLGQIRPEELKERLEWLTGNRTGTAPAALVKHLDEKESPK